MVCVLECGRCHIVAEPVIEKAIARGVMGLSAPGYTPSVHLYLLALMGGPTKPGMEHD